jgi:hypothetical protein
MVVLMTIDAIVSELYLFRKISSYTPMRTLIILTAFLQLASHKTALSADERSKQNLDNIQALLENGWYKATVDYFNYATGHMVEYILNVYVESNRVTKIDFGNGGSVHNGYNSSGYYYEGGRLKFQLNFSNQIIKATTTVTISMANGDIREYTITIK